MSKVRARRITQHKRFVPYGTRPNSACGEVSFMLGTLDLTLSDDELKRENWRLESIILLTYSLFNYLVKKVKVRFFADAQDDIKNVKREM